MTKAELETLKPEKDYVIVAQYPYRVAGLNGTMIEIYDNRLNQSENSYKNRYNPNLYLHY